MVKQPIFTQCNLTIGH